MRGYWSKPNDLSEDQIEDWFKKQIQQIGLSNFEEALYFPRIAGIFYPWFPFFLDQVFFFSFFQLFFLYHCFQKLKIKYIIHFGRFLEANSPISYPYVHLKIFNLIRVRYSFFFFNLFSIASVQCKRSVGSMCVSNSGYWNYPASPDTYVRKYFITVEIVCIFQNQNYGGCFQKGPVLSLCSLSSKLKVQHPIHQTKVKVFFWWPPLAVMHIAIKTELG